MYRTDKAGARQQCAQEGEKESGEDEPDVPALHHAFLLLHHYRMQEGSAREPWHEACVFNWIPSPITAPAEYGVSPVHSEEDSKCEEEPGDHCPDSRNLDPFFAGVPHHQRTQGECEWNGEADIAQIEHRRMDDHLGILEEWIQAIAVVGYRSFHEGEGRRSEVDHGQEKDLNCGQNRASVSIEFYIRLVGEAQYESVGAQQPGPQQKGTFLAAPQGCEFVRGGEGTIGVLQDVCD